MTTESKPHDGLFKLVFRNPEYAAPLLKRLLPEATSRQIDWSTLQLVETSGVDAGLRQYHLDLRFRVKLRGRGESIYFVLEHKSTPIWDRPTQMLGYASRMLEHFDGEGLAGLPQVVCIVVHHGATVWRGGADLLAATAAASDVWSEPGRYLLNLPYLVDDLAGESAEALRARPMPALAKLALFCLQSARHSDDFIAELRPWIPELRTVMASPRSDAQIGLFEYIIRVTDVTYERIDEFLRVEVGPAAEELMKSAYDQILEKGQAQGLAEGLAEGMASVLLKQLASRFGPLPQALVDRVRSSPTEALELWAERVLDAETLEQVFLDG